MKDILALFKHDAELGHVDDDPSLFAKTRVLDGPASTGGLTGMVETVARDISRVIGTGIGRKTGGLRGRIDDGVYGRR